MFGSVGSAGDSGLEEDDSSVIGLTGRSGQHELGLRLPRPFSESHLLGELADRVVFATVTRSVARRHDDARLDRVDELRSLDRAERIAATHRDDKDVDVSETVDLVLGELASQPSGEDDTNVVDRDPHHGRLAGREPEDAHAADLELTRPADLLDLAVTRSQSIGIGPGG